LIEEKKHKAAARKARPDIINEEEKKQSRQSSVQQKYWLNANFTTSKSKYKFIHVKQLGQKCE